MLTDREIKQLWMDTAEIKALRLDLKTLVQLWAIGQDWPTTPTEGHADVGLLAGQHLCGQPGCTRRIWDRFDFCLEHAIGHGLVAGYHRCGHVTGSSGAPCRRWIRGDGFCWQHTDIER